MSTIFLMTAAPSTCINRAKTLILIPIGIGPEHRDVVGLDVQHHQKQAEGQGDEDDAAEPAFAVRAFTCPRIR